MNWCIFNSEEMGSSTLVCVRRVKQEAPEEWDESMPLPGDIIEGFVEDDGDGLFVQAKVRSDLSSQLGKISQRVDPIWLKVKRGDTTLKLCVNVVPEKNSLLQKRFTVKAVKDDRHIAVLGDLTLEQCTELQEMSRRVVGVNCRAFSKKEVKYDWRLKMEAYLPDRNSSIISSILFLPMQGEYSVEATTARCMAWFSAAVSSGIPLVFVNIQTEQTATPERTQCAGKESLWGAQNHNATVQIIQGIRLWFLPGIAEALLEMAVKPGEARFGIDIKRTDEGFICVYSVTKGSAADRAGAWQLYEEANKNGHLLIISRLGGKSLLPSSVCSAGFIHCCDHNEIKDTLASAIEQIDSIQIHFMAWPDQTLTSNNTKSIGVASLLPAKGY
ncbi:uncharacterized protein LOC8258561 [Ricinus communis]|uniref:uncharacterized protein LOC8258561 n=1 Tax=Ricinus communis TaxID=3988 RepID=UPI00201B0C3C|nr:uncharacterized protein LOC8258561 [Ricinus communis]